MALRIICSLCDKPLEIVGILGDSVEANAAISIKPCACASVSVSKVVASIEAAVGQLKTARRFCPDQGDEHSE